MKRRIGIVCLCLCLLMSLAGSALAARPCVIDEAKLFTDAQIAALESRIEAFRERTKMDFAIVTSKAAHNGSTGQVADELYDHGGYGLGAEKSGALLYIDMYEREFYVTTAGEMIDYLTVERVERVLDAGYRQMRSGLYAEAAEAAEAVVLEVQNYVARGIPEGQYRYDIITGQRLTARFKALTSMEMLVCALIGLAVALIYKASVSGAYSLKGNTYSYDYRENVQMQLTGKEDQYLRTTTTRTRKASPPPPSSGSGGGGSHHGGSGVHMSSGGISHGGGGRKF